jgi:hypothetical protein
VHLWIYLRIFVFVVTANAHAAATFTEDSGLFSLFVQHTKQSEPPRSLNGSGVLHVAELFSPLPVCSTRVREKERKKLALGIIFSL